MWNTPLLTLLRGWLVRLKGFSISTWLTIAATIVTLYFSKNTTSCLGLLPAVAATAQTRDLGLCRTLHDSAWRNARAFQNVWYCFCQEIKIAHKIHNCTKLGLRKQVALYTAHARCFYTSCDLLDRTINSTRIPKISWHTVQLCLYKASYY